MLTKSEVIRKGKKYLGKKNPLETFNYWNRMGLLPKPEVNPNDKRSRLFPDYIIDVFKKIREYQDKGMSLAEIKESFKGRREQEVILEQLGIKCKVDQANITLRSHPGDEFGRIEVVTPDGIYAVKTKPFNIFLPVLNPLILENRFLNIDGCVKLFTEIMQSEGRIMMVWDTWKYFFNK